MENYMNYAIYALIALVIYAIYFRIKRLSFRVREAASGIDVQLKKRYDLIPNILQTASKFMEHEKELMAQLTELRSKAMTNTFVASPKEKMEMENLLNQKLNEFKLSVENYPDLKSNQTMMMAMESMSEVEEHIVAARRFYNSNVTQLKDLAEIFPFSIIAHMIGIKSDKYPYFEIAENEKARIDSKDYFK